MGLFAHWDCVIETRQLFPGDTFLLYTDGATEAFNQSGDEFGEQRLLETLQQHSELSSKELVSAITGQVRLFSPHEQADDITVIVAKCT
jgi:sigma-B regulation protein RsbU (phosphoserine phosphatase)